VTKCPQKIPNILTRFETEPPGSEVGNKPTEPQYEIISIGINFT